MSRVSTRVVPPAPYVTETYVGWSGARSAIVSYRRRSASGVLGGKNSNETVGGAPGPKASTMRTGYPRCSRSSRSALRFSTSMRSLRRPAARFIRIRSSRDATETTMRSRSPKRVVSVKFQAVPHCGRVERDRETGLHPARVGRERGGDALEVRRRAVICDNDVLGEGGRPVQRRRDAPDDEEPHLCAAAGCAGSEAASAARVPRSASRSVNPTCRAQPAKRLSTGGGVLQPLARGPAQRRSVLRAVDAM